jgi:SAM-dependent methyltransferase
MPVFRERVVLEVARGVKAFLNFEAGVTRGRVPDPGSGAPSREILQQLERTKGQLRERNEWTGRLKERLSRKDRRIAALEKRLAAKGRTDRRDENVVFDGVTLPPRSMRPCGPNFQDDEFYLQSARKEADRLVADLGLTEESSLLDVGSGPGRLAIGILDRVGEIRRYCGVDVNEDSARWGWKYITGKHPKFQFLHIDVENTRYNPEGAASDSDFSFPFGDGEFDIITLYSVFTHMLTDGVRAYLKEFDRVLRSDGRIFLTAFLEDNVPDVEENPQGYLGREWKGALHCVRYNRKFFEGLLDEAGFRLDDFDTHTWSDDPRKEQGQRGLYLSRKGG